MTTYAALIGRDVDLATVSSLLSDHRVVTICGPGGVGKTRVAEQLVGDLVDAGAAEVILVELGGVTDPALVGHTIAVGIGLRAPGDPRDPAYLAAHLADREVILVLDNCEHVVGPTAAVVAAVVEGCPGIRIIATSQVPLGIAAEAVYPLAPLGLPPETWVLDGDDLPEAVQMFLGRAISALPTFRLSDANSPAVGSIVRRLEGMPLAIELAASRMRVLSPEALLERLDGTFTVLGAGYRDAPERHQSLTASIAWSEGLCTAGELTLWARLSVFIGSFDLEAAERVCSGDDISGDEILDLLAGLVEKSVVVRTQDGRDRYRMLETLRSRGAERLSEADGGAATWRGRHRDWYADLVDRLRADWVGPHQVSWLQRMDAEEANLRAALEFALGDPATERQALWMCFGLKPYWVFAGRTAEARLWTDRVLATGAGSAEDRVLVLAMAASVAVLQGDPRYARTMVDQARAGGPFTDEYVLGCVALSEGQTLLWELDFDGGLALIKDAVSRLRNYVDRFEFTAALAIGGVALTQLGDPAEGLALCTELVDRGERSGEMTARSFAQAWLAFHATRAGDDAEAARLQQGALVLVWELQDPTGIAIQLEAGAAGAFREGREARCAVLLGAAAGQWRRMDIDVNATPLMTAMADPAHFGFRSTVPHKWPDEFARGFGLSAEEAIRLVFNDGEVDDVLRGDDQTDDLASGEVLAPLSRREAEVARLVSDGLSNRDIATRLFISERTAQGHVQSVLRKLDFGARSQIAAWVVRRTG